MAKKILYIDDDYALFRLAQKSLGRLGYETEHAQDAVQGLERLAQGEFHAIVLDHYLQGSTGLDFMRRLDEQGVVLPVVYVTGSSEATIAVDALKAGAADYVIKTVGDDFWNSALRARRRSRRSGSARNGRKFCSPKSIIASPTALRWSPLSSVSRFRPAKAMKFVMRCRRRRRGSRPSRACIAACIRPTMCARWR